MKTFLVLAVLAILAGVFYFWGPKTPEACADGTATGTSPTATAITDPKPGHEFVLVKSPAGEWVRMERKIETPTTVVVTIPSPEDKSSGNTASTAESTEQATEDVVVVQQAQPAAPAQTIVVQSPPVTVNQTVTTTASAVASPAATASAVTSPGAPATQRVLRDPVRWTPTGEIIEREEALARGGHLLARGGHSATHTPAPVVYTAPISRPVGTACACGRPGCVGRVPAPSGGGHIACRPKIVIRLGGNPGRAAPPHHDGNHDHGCGCGCNSGRSGGHGGHGRGRPRR